MKLAEAKTIAGTLSFPSKMPGTSYGLPASACIVGAKLAQVPGSTCHGCYALKDHYTWGNPQKAMRRRLEAISDPKWVPAMVTLLLHKHRHPHFRIDLGKVPKGTPRHRMNVAGWHRWHDSGDIQGVWHLEKICAVAAATPKIRHWIATRETKMVRDFVDVGGIIPDNLTVRISATMVDDPAISSWPLTSTVHLAKPPIGHECPAPTQHNECRDCRACWSKDVSNVSYHKH